TPSPAPSGKAAPSKPAVPKTAAPAAPLRKGAAKKGSGAAEYGQTLNLVHDRLIEAMDLRRLDLDALGSEELWEKTEGTIRKIVAKMDTAGELDALLDSKELVGVVLNEALGMGPMEVDLDEDSVC